MPQSTMIHRPERWDNPFDPEMTEDSVDRVLTLKPFVAMDPADFPPTAPLRDIIRNDMRFQSFSDGDFVVRRGDFGTTSYVIVSGHCLVVLPPGLPDEFLGRAKVKKKGFFQALWQLWENPRTPEATDPADVSADSKKRLETLSDVPGAASPKGVTVSLSNYKTHRMNPGDMFGEIAALARSGRTTSVLAEGDVEVLEIRRQGVRDVRRFVEAFRTRVDKLYRSNSLKVQLHETPIFKQLDLNVIGEIAEKTLFETHGDFDWHVAYNRMVGRGPSAHMEGEPLIAREGDYPDGLLLLRSGFARVSRRINNGEQTVEYIGGGAMFGLDEITHNWEHRDDDPIGLQHSLRAVGYVDILRVPTTIIEKLVLSTLRRDLTPQRFERRLQNRSRTVDRRKTAKPAAAGKPKLNSGILEAVVDYRYINGTAAMVIDLDRCIRCDACVEACAKGHNNNPRFIRHGRVFDQYMIANACMHCVDPVCMIGCPTGAIGRDSRSGQVVINNTTCIGCMTCASNCPYDNIRMAEIRDKSSAFILDEETNAPVVKATKCDLCVGQPGGPACERACPHDALKRMPMGDLPVLAQWLDR